MRKFLVGLLIWVALGASGTALGISKVRELHPDHPITRIGTKESFAAWTLGTLLGPINLWAAYSSDPKMMTR